MDGLEATFGSRKLRPLFRREYDRLVDLGLFEGQRLELLGGRLVLMSPQKGRHATSVQDLNMLLTPRLAGRALVRVQLPLVASDDSEPEPDLAVVPMGDYHDEHPSSALLVVEVADSSLDVDLGFKANLYATMGVADYWVVDLVNDEIVVHRQPTDGKYASIATLRGDAALALLAFPDVVAQPIQIIARH